MAQFGRSFPAKPIVVVPSAQPAGGGTVSASGIAQGICSVAVVITLITGAAAQGVGSTSGRSIRYAGDLGCASEKGTATTSLSMTVTRDVPVGTLVLVSFATNTALAAFPTPATVVDSAGNTWTELEQGWGYDSSFTIERAGRIVYGSVLTNAMVGGVSTITASYPSSSEAKSIVADAFTGAVLAADKLAIGIIDTDVRPHTGLNFVPQATVCLLYGFLSIAGPTTDTFTPWDDTAGGDSWHTSGAACGTSGGGNADIQQRRFYKITQSFAQPQHYGDGITALLGTSRSWNFGLGSFIYAGETPLLWTGAAQGVGSASSSPRLVIAAVAQGVLSASSSPRLIAAATAQGAGSSSSSQVIVPTAVAQGVLSATGTAAAIGGGTVAATGVAQGAVSVSAAPVLTSGATAQGVAQNLSSSILVAGGQAQGAGSSSSSLRLVTGAAAQGVLSAAGTAAAIGGGTVAATGVAQGVGSATASPQIVTGASAQGVLSVSSSPGALGGAVIATGVAQGVLSSSSSQIIVLDSAVQGAGSSSSSQLVIPVAAAQGVGSTAASPRISIPAFPQGAGSASASPRLIAPGTAQGAASASVAASKLLVTVSAQGVLVATGVVASGIPPPIIYKLAAWTPLIMRAGLWKPTTARHGRFDPLP